MNLDLDRIETKALSLASDFGYADSPSEFAREVARGALALAAEVRSLRLLSACERENAREMERQRNAFGWALTQAANGANAAEMAAEAMLALGGAE